ncbi:hypothetical protein E2562_012506 [Oryza meyeriana var. granulata]|uniref:Uncharacterized protein n=1 Tax=Oryza meyeriana var. granulata TaxID=110450 RepID=A0A6G1BUL3_9ORYZ|nr:hypothetical protein E2562_012506 [Oryza meyeriana var. granulata]KAF0892035.1 hypothetical protein E2562_012506 [Oryza meyeriana var. granulata]
MPREDFLNMLLEDGCYILDKFVEPRAGGGGRRSKDVDVDVRHDIIYLAENQIPFFILEKINGIIGWSESDKPLVGVFCSYIEQYVLKWYGYAIGRRCNGTPQPIHLLHLLHILLIGYQLQPAPTRDQSHETAIEMPPEPPHARRFLRWRRAKQYDMARVDLIGVDLISISELGPGPGGETRSILDVKPIGRCGGVGLEFPSLYVDRETWDMLGNLIGLEQGNRKTLSQRVTAYCVLMSQLACTGEDVELLSRRRVADHLMANDKECAEGFADLCNGVIFNLDDPSLNYLRTECVELDRRYRSRPSKWAAWMLQEYCRNPCVAVASVVAIIFIAFGVLQAVYTVLKLRAVVK